MRRRTYLTAAGGLFAAGLAGCTDEEPTGNGNGDTGEEPMTVGEWADGHIEFALPPFQDAEELTAEYEPVFEWLEDGFDGVDTVTATPTTSYSAVVESVVNGHTEMANLSPIIYALAAEDGVNPLAVNWSHGSEAYHTYIATRAETDIETLADIQGHTIAMVDPLSTSGGLFPRYMLDEAGLDAGDVDTEPGDFDIDWAFGHGAALDALQAGHVDAAAYGDFEHPDDDDIVRVAESDPIPFDPVVAKPETPDAVQEALIDRLLETPEDVLEAHRIDRFGEVEPGTYDPVRNVAEAMGVDIADLEEDDD
ncbi:ABC-type transport system periplasmic substrate-binding protein (probable substrate phosphate/phosphonate) [Natronomonas pharaonis DSM 2160]|uniref:ABC-type transport system periplasmic substrate-binding protein (Probable substrate phosphate/phosphonate) n=1 Tax=Natronomonas pharaonis (strain ATCC 35678 / DSM 2160 / CIP 103997 / JCM 8858 / NBRC 14720 / NCIMB 2260 / Gabara) TaxID=348780 RepID=A0A1U7EVE5_NATPD|nr:phosphate/phosphite/phosphonate ABC transporter substrate-binding protein [Natronomonas pharaonis]CAI48965.1 ABC-type transport system periplasmic substrate-binding protein (probable substrate phosphate/phosphonate) [Natronomonas pharaonis DSM 2160]